MLTLICFFGGAIITSVCYAARLAVAPGFISPGLGSPQLTRLAHRSRRSSLVGGVPLLSAARGSVNVNPAPLTLTADASGTEHTTTRACQCTTPVPTIPPSLLLLQLNPRLIN